MRSDVVFGQAHQASDDDDLLFHSVGEVLGSRDGFVDRRRLVSHPHGA